MTRRALWPPTPAHLGRSTPNALHSESHHTDQAIGLVALVCSIHPKKSAGWCIIAVSAIKGEPALSQLIMSYLLARTDRIQDDLIDQFFNSSELRLARVLLRLANYGKEEAPEPVLPHISQEMLAEMIGTTRARINFFMNKFRKLGFITYNGHIEVHSSLFNVLLRFAKKK